MRNMSTQTEAISILRRVGGQPDDRFDLAEAAIALASLELPDRRVDSYRRHLDELVEGVRAEGSAVKLDDRLRFLRRVLVVKHKYRGEDSGDLRNVNLMHVVDRRLGSGIALGILYLHVAEALGWPMAPLAFPGSFLLRISGQDGRAVLDPFRSGKTCRPEELRALVQSCGFDAIDRLTDCYVPLSKRDVLLKLLQNIKRRQLGMDMAEAAVNTLQSMILIAPRRHDLWRELGYMQAERGNLRSAITALEIVCDLSGEASHVQQAELMVGQLRRQLN